ncbi:Uu.00g058750.m01.CDS01 [Anthostomella pinea]|uniref:2'-phosphotransferase n=1 Tax=Anthostomella pinea TaxID=933095 RepID=A0AAI8VRY9_9PEZI|nr:Uu.00g058750.m01.CDS01 [Anthostomella pinea]
MSADGVDQDAADRLQELALGGGSGGGSGKGTKKGGGKGKGKGGGGGGHGGHGREEQISKALSTLLRHQAANVGVTLDGEGFAPLDQVMQWPRLRNLKPTVAEIQAEVANSAKQRFSIKPRSDGAGDASSDPAHWLIRANQGHSIALASEGLHTPITLEAGNIPDVVVHGTYFAFWPAIVASGGLKRMGRTHTHFGTGLPDGEDGKGQGQVHDETDEKKETKVISGMRADAEILIFVDVAQSLRDGGVKWWLSENGVVLTEGNADGVVPTRYFTEVRGRRQGVGLLWRDGEKVADLPEGLVVRVPMGKHRGAGAGGERGRGGRGGQEGGRGGRGS